MAYPGVIEDMRAAIALDKPPRLPAFACSEEFDVKWYGKYCYEEMCQDGTKIAEVWSAAIKEFGYDWAWVQIDDCFEIEPLGVGCQGNENILRATHEYLPFTREAVEGLPKPDPAKDGRMPEKLKALGILREEFGETAAVYGSLAGPYSSVGLVFGMETTMVTALTDPDLLAKAQDFFVEYQARYAKAQFEAGAHALWLGDCDAFSGMLSVEQYRQFVFPHCKRLVDRIKAETDLIIHLHVSEISVPHLLVEAELGCHIVSVGPDADIAAVREAYAGKQCFSGNLDPIRVLMNGTSEENAAEAQRIIETCYDGRGGYLFCTGEMNPRDVPEENMRAMMQAAKRCQ